MLKGFYVAVEGLGLISIAIAAGNKIEENEKVFKAEHRFFEGDFSSAVGGGISDFADDIEPFPKVIADYIVEIAFVYKAAEVFIKGSGKVGIDGIHPFYGDFHCPAAIYDRGFRIDM